MSNATSPTPQPTSARRAKKEAKKSLWQTDLGSMGKKKGDPQDAVVERPPFQPTLPQVNLLPRQVTDSIAIARIRRWLILAILVLAVVIAGAWWLQGSTIARAEEDLATAEAQNAQVRQDLQALTPVKQMYEQITRLQDLVTTTLASQPQAALVIDRLAQAGTAAGGDPAVAFTSVDVTYSGIPQPGDDLNACPSPDPFGTDMTIGCLTFNATAGDRAQVSELLRTLDADPLFIGPFVTSTTATEVATGANGNQTRALVAFSGSAGISLEALQTLLTPEQIDAIANPPEPAASASASASPSAEAGAS